MTKVNKDELFQYYCQDCEEWTFLESPEFPSEIYCPFCGIQNVAIDSDDLRKLEETIKE
ncbi:hypothetical protein ABC970_17575 [Bacillus licheniformis]|uniref:hypothetical protein n=1 Tax=Bacillus TaxID=1386 RepID=UPI00025A9B89|nr:MULTISPECIES: hypothetical protein [Bacillus]MCD2526105.1 hypothetical protein [Bacillus licheniformis]MDE1392049.1 hypothetical protein [Bacillus paralicheniformis]MDE1397136.1 hypothetical protein [Bacillus licheniformis]MEC1037670.1 hypothetical protein [Bacillus licheniformis]QSV42583.1 hypothetical protein G6536_14410 [Bacillus licheniformis]